MEAAEPSAEDIAELLAGTHTRPGAGAAKPDFYSFCTMFDETKQKKGEHLAKDIEKVSAWGRGRMEARVEAAAQELVLKAQKKKSAREVAEEAKLDEFIRQSERCWNCKAFYSDDENHEKACAWHPGPRKQHTSNQNHLDRVLYQCCGAEQIGRCGGSVRRVVDWAVRASVTCVRARAREHFAAPCVVGCCPHCACASQRLRAGGRKLSLSLALSLTPPPPTPSPAPSLAACLAFLCLSIEQC